MGGYVGLLPRPESLQPPQAPPRGDALPPPYITQLLPTEEKQFQGWVQQNAIPWQDNSQSDYDMRGFWKAQQSGDPTAQRAANKHFPDTYKTPYHQSFSNESKYALPSAPRWQGNKLVDSVGNVVFDEDKVQKRPFPSGKK
jgi:hypothetical protein